MGVLDRWCRGRFEERRSGRLAQGLAPQLQVVVEAKGDEQLGPVALDARLASPLVLAKLLRRAGVGRDNGG